MNFLKTMSHFKRPVYKSQLCMEYILTQSQLLTIPLLNPPYQTDLNPTKVTEMIQSYTVHPEFGRFKNTMVIAVRGESFYLVDGQHRLEMIRQIEVNYPFKVLFYPIKTDDEMRQLFREITILIKT